MYDMRPAYCSISNVEIVMCVIKKRRMVNFKLSEEKRNDVINMSRAWDGTKKKKTPIFSFLRSSVVRASNRYAEGHRVSSYRGLRFFLCPMLVIC